MERTETTQGNAPGAPREEGTQATLAGESGSAALVDDDDGDDDFTAEERAAKKLKRGAISAQDFDQTFFENL